MHYMNIRTLILNGQQAIQIDKGKPFELSQDCNPVIPNGFYYLINLGCRKLLANLKM